MRPWSQVRDLSHGWHGKNKIKFTECPKIKPISAISGDIMPADKAWLWNKTESHFITFGHHLVTFCDLSLKEKWVLNKSHTTLHLAGQPWSYVTKILWEQFTKQHQSLTQQRETSFAFLADVTCGKFFFEWTLSCKISKFLVFHWFSLVAHLSNHEKLNCQFTDVTLTQNYPQAKPTGFSKLMPHPIHCSRSVPSAPYIRLCSLVTSLLSITSA